jgi:hypothetical protein
VILKDEQEDPISPASFLLLMDPKGSWENLCISWREEGHILTNPFDSLKILEVHKDCAGSHNFTSHINTIWLILSDKHHHTYALSFTIKKEGLNTSFDTPKPATITKKKADSGSEKFWEGFEAAKHKLRGELHGNTEGYKV